MAKPTVPTVPQDVPVAKDTKQAKIQVAGKTNGNQHAHTHQNQYRGQAHFHHVEHLVFHVGPVLAF
jgi:hypothetical protein